MGTQKKAAYHAAEEAIAPWAPAIVLVNADDSDFAESEEVENNSSGVIGAISVIGASAVSCRISAGATASDAAGSASPPARRHASST